ncbi:hypothetical protein [Brunnivagina elsteri]|uniref:hypothetical protein n=1 Tax=Brunnivagina elsteri TaxID=1247191 RepID=UPI001B809DBC|nr:hypothetical protein [Calothrix elsteri]
MICDTPLALSFAYRVWFLGICDTPLALSSAYRVWILGFVGCAIALLQRLGTSKK